MDLKETEILGGDAGRHWYYRSKSLALRTMLGPHVPFRRVLDVGAGDGFFARELLLHGLAEEVVCVDPGYAREWEEKAGSGVLRFRRAIGTSEADLAILMDVLEHVDDDVGLLAHYGALIGPGRLVAITVPAFPFLWSGHDVFLEHKRRYTLRDVESLMGRSGVTVVRSHYFYGGVFPAAMVTRLAARIHPRERSGSSLKVHHPSTDRLLGGICRAETRVQQYNRIAGLSVFALGVVRPR